MSTPLRSHTGGGGARLWRFSMPRIVAAIIVATFVVSIAFAIAVRNGFAGPATALLLVPSAVVHGELWRLVTWQLIEPSPIALLFACLMLYWFARDLHALWGTRKLAVVYLVLSAVTGALVVAVAHFAWHDAAFEIGVLDGGMAIALGLSIAWACAYPEREILLFFVLPARGNALIFLSLFVTAIFTAYYGFALTLPEWIAQVLMLVYMGQFRRWYLQLRLKGLERQRAAMHKPPRRKSNVVHLVRDDDDDPGNLPN